VTGRGGCSEVPAGAFTRDTGFAYRLRDGRITERWAIRDDLAMLLHFGALHLADSSAALTRRARLDRWSDHRLGDDRGPVGSRDASLVYSPRWSVWNTSLAAMPIVGSVRSRSENLSCLRRSTGRCRCADQPLLRRRTAKR
jgi:hypothetical protein